MQKIALLIALLLGQVSCMLTRQPASADQTAERTSASPGPSYASGPPVLVYKTRKDYANNVPVLLSADKTRIVSYPEPSDLRQDHGYVKPLPLHNDYLLDQKGIGMHVAFLKLTYEEYASLPQAPSKAEMRELIIDDDPLLELCNCGNRNAFENVPGQVNQLIDSGLLRKQCRVIR